MSEWTLRPYSGHTPLVCADSGCDKPALFAFSGGGITSYHCDTLAHRLITQTVLDAAHEPVTRCYGCGLRVRFPLVEDPEAQFCLDCHERRVLARRQPADPWRPRGRNA